MMRHNNIYNIHGVLFIILSIFINYNVISQTNEIGVFLGGSLFHGDVGYNNAEYAILESKPVFGLLFKRNFNYHFSLHFSVNRGELYANDDTSLDFFSTQRNLNFKSKITELGLIAEFNFRPYMSRDPEYNHSPVVFLGITKFYFNPKGEYTDNNWHDLRPLGTEGQGSDIYPARELYKLNGIALPFGIGYKINIYDFLTVNINLGWRVTFTDYIDDVSTTYVDESILSTLGEELANQSESIFTNGDQRGNPYNNDKYGFVGISILYSIKDPNEGCDNIIY